MLILIPILLVLWTLGWTLRPRLTAPAPADNPAIDPARVSIIIPARNEARNLPRLIHSIRGQKLWPLEVLVVDDDSEDHTADIAQAMGARVIASEPLPEGWRGKTWACHQGTRQAKGEYFLFLDADTWLEDHGFKLLTSAYREGVLAVGPWHQVEEAHEWNSLFFNLAMVAGTVPDALFGQCLLISRKDYQQCGGHEKVCGEVLENFHLARHLREKNIPLRSMPGRGILNFRMYPGGLGEVIEGWSKGFASGAKGGSKQALWTVILWMIGLMGCAIGLLVARDPVWLLLYLAYALQVALLGRKVGSFPPLLGLVYPLPLIFFFLVFTRSAMKSGRDVTWKGRRFDVD